MTLKVLELGLLRVQPRACVSHVKGKKLKCIVRDDNQMPRQGPQNPTTLVDAAATKSKEVDSAERTNIA